MTVGSAANAQDLVLVRPCIEVALAALWALDDLRTLIRIVERIEGVRHVSPFVSEALRTDTVRATGTDSVCTREPSQLLFEEVSERYHDEPQLE